MYYTKKLSRHKAVELSIGQNGWHHNYITIDICWNKEQSHAGFHFLVAILKWNCEFNIFDCRHWDTDEGCWQECVEPEKKKDKDKNEWEDQIGI